MNENLVLFILGTTGVGKSKLAIELAKEFNGEIISSDSMQLYKGGDIVTNKVTKEEMNGIEHHMMSILETNTMDYNISNFTSTALPIINEIINKGKLPIIVGGTHYYTLSLIWNNSIISENEQPPINNSNNNNEKDDKEEKGDILNVEYSYEKLKELDPVMAEKLHRNDHRKIKRAIDICLNNGGLKNSDIIRSQNNRNLRFRSCLLWLECLDDNILLQRLNSRVDDMYSRGLMKEVFDLFQNHNINKESTEDFTKGISQAIGIKELYPCYESRNLSKKDQEKTESLGLEMVRVRTKRYAVNQVKWIKKLTQDQLLEIHRLDTTDLTKWNDIVLRKSIEIVKEYIDNPKEKTGYLDNSKKTVNPAQSLDNWKKHYCDKCQREINGDHQWNEHIKSKFHLKGGLSKKGEKKRKYQELLQQKSDNNNNIINEDDGEIEHVDKKLNLDSDNNNSSNS
ncbi:putative isopentenyltransferase [Tieghemostelium lacteum]|uniref:Putative isopentenyltransferase n=1 Tax=Tieghemostelium lacteum TaxID=361077 RepID=A0A151Z2Z9_TIELA|nr:putative isopentenyltransferase [Tieghemostelium lacteum]|eukprot:KYQ88332.1 putative isopentenyltransferase [Tieghemostelium lacteum]